MPVTNFDQLTTSAGALNPNAQDTHTFFIAGGQTTGAKKLAFLAGFPGTITDIRAYLDTAPTGASFILDVNKNGTTLYTNQANRPTVAISGNASTTTLPDIVSIAAGDRMTVDIDQIGSGVAGSDLYVSVTVKRATVN